MIPPSFFSAEGLRISVDLHGFCILNSIPEDIENKNMSNGTEFQWKNTMEK